MSCELSYAERLTSDSCLIADMHDNNLLDVHDFICQLFVQFSDSTNTVFLNSKRIVVVVSTSFSRWLFVHHQIPHVWHFHFVGLV